LCALLHPVHCTPPVSPSIQDIRRTISEKRRERFDGEWILLLLRQVFSRIFRTSAMSGILIHCSIDTAYQCLELK
jgi:uncharacterized linocin/CFP29 family protein